MKRREASPSGSVRTRTAWIGIVLVVIAQILAMGSYFHQMNASINEQIVQGLTNENEKAKNYLHNMIDTKFEFMRYIASLVHVATDHDEVEIWDLLGDANQEEHRLGFITGKGKVYYGEHETGSVAEREYFAEVMKGEPLISPLLEEAMRGEDSICLLYPVPSHDGQTRYAIVMEYTTMEIGSYINDNNEWSAYGVNLIVDSKGRLIGSCEGLEGYATIYDALHDICEHEGEADCPLGEMEEKIARGEAGYFNCGGNNQELLLHHCPVGINDWSVISVGNETQYEAVMGRIQGLSIGIVIVTTILLFLCAILVLYIARRHKKRFDDLETDKITGVYTRAAGHKLVLNRFQGGQKLKCYGCLFVDLDGFKNINDTYGHEEGDKALKLAGSIIKGAVRETDIVYRYGGDEFCVWLFGDGGKPEMEIIVDRIQARVRAKSSMLRFSIGAATVESDETDCDEIIRRADAAVYEAKRQGKNRSAFYDEIE